MLHNAYKGLLSSPKSAYFWCLKIETELLTAFLILVLFQFHPEYRLNCQTENGLIHSLDLTDDQNHD